MSCAIVGLTVWRRASLPQLFLRRVRYDSEHASRGLSVIESVSQEAALQLCRFLSSRQLMFLPYEEFTRVSLSPLVTLWQSFVWLVVTLIVVVVCNS